MLTPDEQRALRECLTPEARSALLLEWLLNEVRGEATPAEPHPRLPRRSRKTDLGRRP